MKNRKHLKKVTNSVKCYSSKLTKDCDIRESLTPIIFMLKLFGLYHEVNDINFSSVKPMSDSSSHLPIVAHSLVEEAQDSIPVDVHITRSNAASQPVLPARMFSKWMCLLTKLYSIFVLIVLFLNLVKYFWALANTNSVSVSFKIVMINWNTQNCLTTLCLFISCWKIRHFRTFYKKWAELFMDPITRELRLEPTNCRIGVIVITLIGTLFFLVNVTAVGTASLYQNISIQDYLLHNLLDPLPVTTWTLVLIMVVHVMNTASWTLPNTFVICTAHILAAHFRKLTKILQQHIESSGGNIPPKIKDIRTRHLRLCDLLDTYNLFLKWHLTVTYTSTIIGCCFILYELIFRQFDAFGYALNIFWLTTNALTALALSFSLSHLHEVAHEPLELLFNIETDNTDMSQVLQVQLFLSKLTGTSIGATVLDLFVVTKESLLTIAGAYVTYFLLVIQFNI